MSINNQMQKQKVRVVDYIMQRLADEGIRDIFLLPGGGAMYLDDAIACESRINPIACHHEQACGIAAEAYGRVSESGFGVAVVTTGPGATNIITPVAGAWIESLPLLVLSGQVKRSDAINGRMLRQSGVQEVDIISVVRPLTKLATTISRPEDVRLVIEEALWCMHTGRKGPVWIDVPLDVQAAMIDVDLLDGFVPPSSTVEPFKIDDYIDQLNNLLSISKRPLFLIGHGVRISGATDLFRMIAENLNIPSVFTWNASDTLPWEHPLYIGRPGVVAARSPNFAVQNCDCLIVIGCRLDNIITAYNPKGFAREAVKVIIDIDQNELARHEMNHAVKICSDAKSFLIAWQSKLPLLDDLTDWRNRCTYWKNKYPPLDGKIFDGSGPMSHFQFVDQLSHAIPSGSQVITGSSGLAIEVFYTAFKNKLNQRIFLTSGLGSMGYGLSASIGACIGSQRRPTVCVESDGSLMLNLQELATLKHLNLPITLVIMNNNGYASIRNTQRNYFNHRYIASGIQSGLWIPDFMKLAKSLDIECIRLTNIKQVTPQLFDGSLKIIEVILKEDETLTPKVSALPQPDGSITSMPLEDMSPLLDREEFKNQMIVALDPASEKVN